jgi:maleamate amidohydrolase
LNVACTYAFIGSHPNQTMAEAMNDFHTACGPVAWEALPKIAKLTEAFREAGMPVIYTQKDLETQSSTLTGATKGDLHSGGEITEKQMRGNQIAEMVKPLPGEWVVKKSRASAFHGTLVHTYLTMHSIDTLIITGTTTSGCIRATTVDAFSHGYNVFVADDCCVDRAQTPHMANLWDMNAKYATVLSHEEIINRIQIFA